jgi:hypothetical protein
VFFKNPVKEKAMKKSEFRKYPVGSSAYVIAHAKWRASRGKRPSATLGKIGVVLTMGPIRNPRAALKTAQRGVSSQQIWTLGGTDQFDGTDYSIPGQHFSEEDAITAAKKRCRSVERSQPSEHSGGPQGIQDLTYVVKPTGGRIHVRL